jgi:hypothetical protein
MFCLQLLNTASIAGMQGLEKFHGCQIVEDDFRPLVMEREKGLAEKALKKVNHKPSREPSFHSHLVSGWHPRNSA